MSAHECFIEFIKQAGKQWKSVRLAEHFITVLQLV